MNFPRWVHPVHHFVPPEVLKIPRVAQSIDRARYFAQLSLSVLVGGNLGLQVCLFPLVRSCSFNFHNDWYYVTVQLKRTCLLLVDKTRHPPLGPFTESFWQETYLLGCEFEILGFQFFDLFQEIHALEKPRSIFWINIFLLGVFLLMVSFFGYFFVRGPRRGVLILVIPAVTQVPPIFWIRFFLPVVVTLGAGLLLWGWRRSGKDFNLFLWELHFPAGTDPSRVAQFFDRLKWFLLPAGVAPLVWLGCDLYWIYLNCPSYLFPELNLDGLKQVSSRLESLPQRINNLEVDPHVRESLLARYKVLVEKYNQLTYFLVVVDDVIRPCYPGGVSPEYKINPASLLRRVMPLVVLTVLAGLVFLSRKKNNPTTSRGVLLVFFFFNGDGFLEEWSFFFYSFVSFFLFICLMFNLKSSPPGQTHSLTLFIPAEHQGNPLVEESPKRLKEMTQLAVALEVSLWGVVMAKVSSSTPALLFGLTTFSKISLLCYRTGLFCLDKLLNLKGIPPHLHQFFPVMFFELTRDNDHHFPWWVLVFFFSFVLSFFFLRRVNFPRWVHPVHYFLAPEFLGNPEVNKSIEQCRKYLHVGISTTVGVLTGFIFWLSPFLRSYPFDFHHEGMHIYIQVNRTCRLLLDKLNHLPPGSFTPCTDYEVAQLAHLFNQLSSDLLKLSAQVSRLEDPLPFLWSSLLWFVPSVFVLLTFTFLAIRGPRRGVFVFVIPGVTQVPPAFWVRFFFPLIFALLVGVFLWGWHRSGKDFVIFNQELYFPPGTGPSRVVDFFHRLKWFLLVTGAAPLLWMGLDFWWICSCSKSYLFPELNTSGLSQVPLLLDHLHDSILNLRVDESTRKDFLLQWVVLEDEFYRLSGYLLQLDDVIRPAYPEGATVPDNNLTLFLRRGWGVLSLLLVGGLLFFVRVDRKELT